MLPTGLAVDSTEEALDTASGRYFNGRRAGPEPPLLNSVSVHEPFALRAIVVVRTVDGIYGLGETYGDEARVTRLNRAGALLVGADAFNINQFSALVAESLLEDSGLGGHGTGGMVTTTSLQDRVLSAFDVACLDIQGKILGVLVSTLLGGTIRDEVAFSGYLFYKWAGHPGQAPDAWGEALDAKGIVAQARKTVYEYGFTAFKAQGRSLRTGNRDRHDRGVARSVPRDAAAH